MSLLQLSVVFPVFNEAGNLEPLTDDLLEALAEIGRSFEIIFVDDGSEDHTKDKLFELAAQSAEKLLAQAGTQLAPALLENYPAVAWEDQDECLEVRPEDVDI